MNKEHFIPTLKVKEFMLQVMSQIGVADDVSRHVTEALLFASLRGIDSHGVRLLPHYVRAVKGGRINARPKYKFNQTSASTGVLDADNTFGHAASMEAVNRAVSMAKEAGSGHVAVQKSSHFGAASFYACEIAKQDMIGMTMTNTDSQLRTPRGKRPFLGNNPICFAAPSNNDFIFSFDTATSVVTYNKIKRMASLGQTLPSGVAADAQGNETTDPSKAAMLLPFGEHRGFGLSLVIELFCSMLSGMAYGPNIPKMYEAPLHQKRDIGQFVSAYKIDAFQPIDIFKERFSEMLNLLRSEPAANKESPILIPGDKETKCHEERLKTGIPILPEDYEAFTELGNEFGLSI